ncbi:MAG: competence protein TfoX [Candidatus Kerfeldbacteria bacterium CG15_BIG_FIL_POST_REV_8_21_14_020_45_12]|uniref:Competence protein TfoX n=1 Tax=Candidatus Kerfeldbacteria bacterium CG15_BIG_FIL_POST_REV_8_21_14_020_45_12 TaxID=2014247 RepID=A0A2M7H2J4_9BACT|nr:MAG: competence protein TfoX [Candidatus Kerfeldbacteria bacterium CG15_BIG_FIL_POST_REV_8_21_14_020_45_12]PJA92821.1 MAG: competence protein TfoX [Candidatus Kerfeldbacteria bacterium CG_4_9_14_3_um_filter_45_8]
MSKDNSFVDFILHDAMSHIDGIRARSMFGGHGLYQYDVFFALIFNDELYLKVDEENLADFEKAGSRPFTYKRQGKDMALSYWSVPANLLENPKELGPWIDRAVEAGLRAKTK